MGSMFMYERLRGLRYYYKFVKLLYYILFIYIYIYIYLLVFRIFLIYKQKI